MEQSIEATIRPDDPVLVAIMNNAHDFALARDKRWYRIPVSSDKWLKRVWPPSWLAFYQTKIFGVERYAIRYYADVRDIRDVPRSDLFPNQPHDQKSQKIYHQLILGPLQRLPRPIISHRRRRILFIPTNGSKFLHAAEINDLYNESPLEDRLWVELKRLSVNAERQELVNLKGKRFFLDFAVYCVSGKLDVETDGDKWHHNPESAKTDNKRDNLLVSQGWKVIRFTSAQIDAEMDSFCLPTIKESIDTLHGLETGGILGKSITLDSSRATQLRLFDDIE